MKHLVAAIAAAFTLSTAVHAAYPEKPVRLIVPFPAGGGVDIVARGLAPHLTERWGQQVIVDNRPGAGATLGAELAAKSPPDGYTLLLANTAHAINATLFKKLPYDAVRSFEPISLIATQPSLLVVHPAVPVKTVKDLVALAKSRPGGLNYASSGNGTPPHLSAAMFETLTGVQMTHIPYKGAAPALTDLLGGQVQLMFATLVSVSQHVQSGRVRAVAVTSAKRTPSLPDVPTVAETVPGFEATAWFMLLAPAKTSKSIVDQIARDAAATVQRADVKSRFAKEGADTVGSAPDRALGYLREEIERWGKVIKAAHIQSD